MFTEHLYKPTHVHLPSWGAPVSSSSPPRATVRAATANSSSLAACSSDSASVVSLSRSRPMASPCKKKKMSHANSGKTTHGDGVHEKGSREVRDNTARQFQHPTQEPSAHRRAQQSISGQLVPRTHSAHALTRVTYPRPRQVHPVLLPRLHKRVCLRGRNLLVRLKLFPHVLQRQSKKKAGSNHDTKEEAGGQTTSSVSGAAGNVRPPSSPTTSVARALGCEENKKRHRERPGYTAARARAYTVAEGALRGGQHRPVDAQQRAVQAQHLPAAGPENTGGSSRCRRC